MIIYKKGSLFDASKESILVHACNAQGVWGRGIAVEFKQRFPVGYEEYQKYCRNMQFAVGTSFITSDHVGCLITSFHYGDKTDLPKYILESTYFALKHFLKTYYSTIPINFEIHSNKFNSGLFGVPWERTEEVLKRVLKDSPINWTVWEYESN